MADLFRFMRQQKGRDTASMLAMNDTEEAAENAALEEIYDSLAEWGIANDPGKTSFLAAIKQRATNKRLRYAEYEDIARDPLIVQPIEMMVDDATVLDEDRGMSFWVESKDTEFAKAANEMLAKYVEPFLDNIAFSILSRGEYAMTINRGGKDKAVTLIPIGDLHHLHRVLDVATGNTLFFTTSEDLTMSSISADKIQERSFGDIVHFVNPSYQYSQRVKVATQEYYLISAESIFTDKLIETYRTLTYLEQGIIRARTAKSKSVRIFNVDVTGLSPKKAQAVVQYLNGILNAEEMIDKGTGFYEASHSRPGPVSCVLPVRGEKGAVRVEDFSPSADIKDIVDIEYFRDKLLSGLRVPKQFLGYGEEMVPGVGSNGSLMRIDVRYARTVKRLRRRIREGIKDAVDKAFTEAPEYTIASVPVSSPEDEERSQEIEQRIGIGQTLFDSMTDPTTMEMDRQKVVMLRDFFDKVVPIPSLAKFLGVVASKSELYKKAEPTRGEGETPEADDPTGDEQEVTE